MWHLMELLDLDETGCNSGFPPFQISGTGIEALRQQKPCSPYFPNHVHTLVLGIAETRNSGNH